jgi:tripartite-type tricarboxylate transporter receptor subunit TctC
MLLLPTARPLPRRAMLCAAAATAVLLATPLPALSQAWPNKPIKLIVPFPPGGGTDTFARPLAQKLAAQLGQSVVIDNRGGAGGNIGATAAAKSAPDGYTFLLGAVHHTVAMTVYKTPGFDVEKDLMPITGVAYVPDVLVINSKLPATNVRELITYAKANPARINYGSSGNGTTRHLAGEIFNRMTGTAITHIPYKGSGPAMTGLIGGEVQLIFEGLGSAATHIRANSIRALAVTSPRRSAAFPDIPTMAEAGVPGFESQSWYGMWAPAGTSPEIVRRMHAEVVKALASPDLAATWAAQGADPGGESPEQFGRFIRTEVEKWGKVARDLKISAE